MSCNHSGALMGQCAHTDTQTHLSQTIKTSTRAAHFQLVLEGAQAHGLRKCVFEVLCRKQNKLHFPVPYGTQPSALSLVDIAIKGLVDRGSSALCTCHASAHMQLPWVDKRQASLGMQVQILLLTTHCQHQPTHQWLCPQAMKQLCKSPSQVKMAWTS